jgi:hypothetical protein
VASYLAAKSCFSPRRSCARVQQVLRPAPVVGGPRPSAPGSISAVGPCAARAFAPGCGPRGVHVQIRSLSTSAKPPRTAIIKRPVLVPVSAHGSASDRNCASASTICLTMANRSNVLRASRSRSGPNVAQSASGLSQTSSRSAFDSCVAVRMRKLDVFYLAASVIPPRNPMVIGYRFCGIK